MKSDLILVVHINIGRMSKPMADKYVAQCKRNIDDRMKDFTVFIVPTRSGDTKIECINPVMLDKKTYKENVEKVLVEYQALVNEFIEKGK